MHSVLPLQLTGLWTLIYDSMQFTVSTADWICQQTFAYAICEHVQWELQTCSSWTCSLKDTKLQWYTGVHLKCIPFHCNIAHEPKDRGMKTKRIWVGCKIKFIIRATWVSKSFHLKRYTHSC
jgi:hypothetical protein